ncbi:hypothetical protein IC617_05950 [Neiella sp. HB171785]|uniref:Uncharacterized protein n=1 Tax=Neiella litorisoli TaxID=2771431 RepID=A0A8J6UFM7_9GAMM|nr:hypothetical protein [Neiella litorisoli]MBD1388966.1 hypothetical protein [Neiella litorisoli]
MSRSTDPQIAINAMRSRLTVVGFNIAIVSFQIAQLPRFKGGVTIAGFDHSVHLSADLALLLALALSLLSLVAFIASSSISTSGSCDHWSFIAGDLLMYAGLANAATAFFAPLHESFVLASQGAQLEQIDVSVFGVVIHLLGGFVWLVSIYVGPIVSLARSPFGKRCNQIMSFAYVVSLMAMFWFYHLTFSIEASSQVLPSLSSYFLQFMQPLFW